jgi:hypothetical protein
MTQHVVNKREAKTGFARIGVVLGVLVVLAVVWMALQTAMTTARSAADPNTPSVDVRTSAIQEAKQRPPT